MTFFTASFETVILRFASMMAAVIAPFLMGVPILAIIALPIFLSAVTAVTFFPSKTETKKIMADTIEIYNSKAA
jgi:hypothetical protein